MNKYLAIDLGNTRTKLGFFEQDVFLKNIIIKNNELRRLKEILKGEKIDKAIISSVNREAEMLIDYNGFEFTCMRLSSTTALPFKHKYTTIETLGADRMAVVAAGQKAFPNQNVLVIDAGSCITYDFLTDGSIYLGGAISPGIMMRLRAMHGFTNALPLLKWDGETVPKIIGNSTVNSIFSGAINGAIAEIEGFMSLYNQQYSDVKTIITGGDARFFEKAVKNTIFADPNLVLKGLNELLIYNGE